VDGVYTRGAEPCQTLLSDVTTAANCRHITQADECVESVAAVSSEESISQHTSVTDSITVVSSNASSDTTSVSASTQLSTAADTDVSATLSLQAGIQLQAAPGADSPPMSSPPVKTGILPPAANVNVSSTLVGTSSSVTQADKDWKEFEEALCEEFVTSPSTSSAATAAAAARCRQPKNPIFPSYMQQPLRPRVPSLMMPSTVLLLFTTYFMLITGWLQPSVL